MVSGRSEQEVECAKCGKLWIELDLADRKKRICVMCASDVPQQLSLLPRLKPKEKQRKQCEAHNRKEQEPCIEQLALLPDVPPKPAIKPVKQVDPEEYLYRVLCEKCRRKLDPCAEPWVAGCCKNCWPAQPAIHKQYMEEWRRYHK